jgi:hypothetical protein
MTRRVFAEQLACSKFAGLLDAIGVSLFIPGLLVAIQVRRNSIADCDKIRSRFHRPPYIGSIGRETPRSQRPILGDQP